MISKIKDFVSNVLIKEKRVGSARRSRYDISLHNSSGASFLVFLIALMNFLMMLTIAIFLLLSGTTKYWQEGIEGKLTIEIPVDTKASNQENNSEMNKIASEIEDKLSKINEITSVKILSKSEVEDLLSAWFDDNVEFTGIPMPMLIDVEYDKHSDAVVISKTQKIIDKYDGKALLETHEDWIGEIKSIIGSIKGASFLVTLIILSATVMAVAGGVKNQLHLRRSEVDLLHLMGAKDHYITVQFQIYSLIQAVKGGAIGVVIFMFFLWIFSLIVGNDLMLTDNTMKLGTVEMVVIFLTPVVISLISALTAKFTVKYDLERIP